MERLTRDPGSSLRLAFRFMAAFGVVLLVGAVPLAVVATPVATKDLAILGDQAVPILYFHVVDIDEPFLAFEYLTTTDSGATEVAEMRGLWAGLQGWTVLEQVDSVAIYPNRVRQMPGSPFGLPAPMVISSGASVDRLRGGGWDESGLDHYEAFLTHPCPPTPCSGSR